MGTDDKKGDGFLTIKNAPPQAKPLAKPAHQKDLQLPRKVWHMSMGLMMAGLYWAGLPKIPSLSILAVALVLDLLVEFIRLRNPNLNKKIVKFWGPIMRPSEASKVSGVPYYLAAAILTIAIFPKTIAILSILYLACGDPIASAFGIQYGDIGKRLPNGKSIVGTLAGVVSCAILSFVYFSSIGTGWRAVWVLTLIGALSGGAAELMPLEVDDNFSIPIVSGFALWVGWVLLGVS